MQPTSKPPTVTTSGDSARSANEGEATAAAAGDDGSLIPIVAGAGGGLLLLIILVVVVLRRRRKRVNRKDQQPENYGFGRYKTSRSGRTTRSGFTPRIEQSVISGGDAEEGGGRMGWREYAAKARATAAFRNPFSRSPREGSRPAPSKVTPAMNAHSSVNIPSRNGLPRRQSSARPDSSSSHRRTSYSTHGTPPAIRVEAVKVHLAPKALIIPTNAPPYVPKSPPQMPKSPPQIDAYGRMGLVPPSQAVANDFTR